MSRRRSDGGSKDGPARLRLRTLIALIALLAGMLAAGIGHARRGARYRVFAAREARLAGFWKQMAMIHSTTVQQLNSLRLEAEQSCDEFHRPKNGADDMMVDFLAKRARREKVKIRHEYDKDINEAVSGLTRSTKRAAFHARRSTAYLRAALYPWLSAPADEREPN